MYPFRGFRDPGRRRYMLIDGEAPMAIEIETERRRFTRVEYHGMAEAGTLRPRERVELIRGEIVRMAAFGPRHVVFTDNLTALLVPRLVNRAVVSVASGTPLSDDTEPEPDIKIVRRRANS
jgi:Uma2 family endonuclease